MRRTYKIRSHITGKDLAIVEASSGTQALAAGVALGHDVGDLEAFRIEPAEPDLRPGLEVAAMKLRQRAEALRRQAEGPIDGAEVLAGILRQAMKLEAAAVDEAAQALDVEAGRDPIVKVGAGLKVRP